MENTDEASIRWAMIKGLVVSQLAIIKTLMAAGVISKKDIFDELGELVEHISETRPDSIMFLEPIKALQDGVSLLLNDDESSVFDSELWLSDFIGKA